MSKMVLDILFGVLIAGVLALYIFLRSRNSMGTPLGRAASIMTDLNHNEKLVENFDPHRRAGKFKTGAWRKNRDKVDFLPLELRMALSQVFEMSEEVNERIEAARRFKSDSYMAGIDVSKLKAPLAKSKEQLREWLQENMQNPEYMPQRRRGLCG